MRLSARSHPAATGRARSSEQNDSSHISKKGGKAMNTLIYQFVMASAKGAAWLLVWSWQAAVLLTCVWAGLKIFRVKSPALRHQVWLFALIAVAAMPILSGVVQNLPLPQPSNRALSYAVELPRIVVTNDAAPAVQTPSPAASVRPSTKKPIILSLSFALWLAGVCAFVMKAAINGVRLRRLRAGARCVSLADLDCDECDCEALRNGKAPLALSDEIRSPILLGVLRPMIVFPADIASWTSPMERRAMLRHELAHVGRQDHYVNLFQTVLGAIFFFHPLARYAGRQLTLEREMACDDHVVGSGAEAETYAESIIKAAERGIGAPRGAHQLALFSPRQILERRIEMILNKDRARVIAHQWRYLTLFAAMITAVSLLLIPSRGAKIAAQPAGVNDYQQILIDMVRQVVEGIPRQINLGGPSPNPNLDFKDFVATTGEPMVRTLDNFARQNLTVTRVEADDFQWVLSAKEIELDGVNVKISDDSTARIDFLGTIYFKDSARGEERSAAERYTVTMVKVNGQWRAIQLPPPPLPRPVKGARNDDPPPPPPPPTPQIALQEQTLLALIQEYTNAVINRDTSVVERLFADDYISTGPNGHVGDKAQEIAGLKSGDMTISKVGIDDFRARIDGNSAVTNFLTTIFFKVNNEDGSAQYRTTCAFVKRDGRWLILASHNTRKQ
jgi:beta-lactamase regulating signal transducer with metallopeptidase domain/ketosteroid isomerase-like protein